jgi:hypothetical protein
MPMRGQPFGMVESAISRELGVFAGFERWKEDWGKHLIDGD